MNKRAIVSLAMVPFIGLIMGLGQGSLYASSVGSAWSYPASTPVGPNTPDISDSTIASQSPSVAMSGGNAVAVWVGDAYGTPVIQSASSVDGGVSWSTPTSTPQGADTPDLSAGGAADVAPQVAMSGDTAVAVWALTTGGFDVVQTAHSSDGGVTWSDPTSTPTASTPNLSDPAANAYAPQISVSGQNAVAAWLLDMGGLDIVQVAYSIDGGATWSDPTSTPGRAIPAISADNENALSPAIAMSGSAVVATWYSDTTGLVSVARSADAGATWTYPTGVPSGAVAPALSAAGEDAALGRVSISGSTAVVVWKRSNGTNYVIQTAFSTDSGDTWNNPTSTPIGSGTPDLSAAGEDANDISISMDGDTVVALWTRSNGVVDVTQTVRSANGGITWTSPTSTPQGADTANLSDPVQVTIKPRVAVSGANATAVWQAVDPLSVGGFPRFFVQSANSNDGGETWSSPVSAPTGSSPNISASGASGFDAPSLAASGSRAVVLWTFVNIPSVTIQAAYSVAPARVSGAAPYIPLQAFPTPTRFTAQECADYAVANSATLELDWDSLAGRSAEGWSPSYAEFPNNNSGGWVCTRQPAYSDTGGIIFR